MNTLQIILITILVFQAFCAIVSAISLLVFGEDSMETVLQILCFGIWILAINILSIAYKYFRYAFMRKGIVRLEETGELYRVDTIRFYSTNFEAVDRIEPYAKKSEWKNLPELPKKYFDKRFAELNDLNSLPSKREYLNVTGKKV